MTAHHSIREPFRNMRLPTNSCIVGDISTHSHAVSYSQLGPTRPPLSPSHPKEQPLPQPASHMPPYCDCLTSGKEINGQTASLWLSRVETARSDMSDTAHAVASATLLSETGPH